MSDRQTPADDRTEESIDMVAQATENDPADLVESTADQDAAKMHGESDDIAERADPDSPGHGPNA